MGARKRMLPLPNLKKPSQPKEVGVRKIPKQKSSLLKPNRKQNLCRKLKKRNPSAEDAKKTKRLKKLNLRLNLRKPKPPRKPPNERLPIVKRKMRRLLKMLVKRMVMTRLVNQR